VGRSGHHGLARWRRNHRARHREAEKFRDLRRADELAVAAAEKIGEWKIIIMKINFWLPILILSTVYAKAQDVQVITTAKTNLETKVVIVTDTFTRNGKTNLVRQIKSQNTAILAGTQKIYHDNFLLGTVLVGKDGNVLEISTEPNPKYSLSFDLWHSDKHLIGASIMDTNYLLIDGFNCTNGILTPLRVLKLKNSINLIMKRQNLLKPTAEQENQTKNLAEKWKNLLINTKTIKCAAFSEK
jgi:hypothetical protein